MVETILYPEPPAVGPLLARALVSRRGRMLTPDSLPERTVRIPRQRTSVPRLAAYARVCSLPLTDTLPPTWLHVLAFPLHTAILAAPDFPVPPAGLVHVRNQMTSHRLAMVGDDLDLQATTGLVLPHAKGVAFEIIAEARVDGELVWTGVSTYLARGAATGPGEQRPVSAWPSPAQHWHLPADLGRRYAAVAGDMNPIHLSVATARLFGYRRPIAHGMWTHARALAALGHRPERYTVAVDFHRPILLPARVGFSVRGTEFAVIAPGSGKQLISGKLDSLPPG
ncbi:MAG: MaoC family dehydratase [Propioniciclava sp.]